MSQQATRRPKFDPGRIVATPASLIAIRDSGQSPEIFIDAHLDGYWGGELCDEDHRLNDEALIDGSRLLSAYKTLRGERIWILTEAADDEGHRYSTTILLPEEY